MTDDIFAQILAQSGVETLNGDNWTLELPYGIAESRALMAKYFNGQTPEQFMDRMASRLPGTCRMTMYLRDDGAGDFSFGVYGAGGVLYARGERKFNAAEGLVEHDELMVNERFQGRGLGARLLANAISAYRAAGFKTIECGAGRQNGGYTWARLGFLASRPGWDGLREHVWPRVRQLEDQLPAQVRQTLRQIMSNDDPRALWLLADLDHKIDGVKLGRKLLAGNAWPARFDLSNPAQINRLADSIRARQTPASAAQDRPAPTRKI